MCLGDHSQTLLLKKLSKNWESVNTVVLKLLFALPIENKECYNFLMSLFIKLIQKLHYVSKYII